MTRKRTRRAPPLWVLLDILMVCVLMLVSMPIAEQGATYKFLGLPEGSVLFEADLPLRADQRHWRHFDFEAREWAERSDVTPHGRKNFLCQECGNFLPEGTRRPEGLMVGLPAEINARIHEVFFKVCDKGDCAPTLYIHRSGTVSTSPLDDQRNT